MVTTRGMASLAAPPGGTPARHEQPSAKRRVRRRSPSPPPTPPLSRAAAAPKGCEKLRGESAEEEIERLQDARGKEQQQRRSPTSPPHPPLFLGAATAEAYEKLPEESVEENLERLQNANEKEQQPTPTSPPPQPLSPGAATPESYEKLRDQRIKDNLERLQKLGILDLSLQLKSHLQVSLPSAPSYQHRKKRDTATGTTSSHKPPPPALPTRRSSRLQHITPVSYVEIRVKKDTNSDMKRSKNIIEEGAKEEIYTDEHEKLLGTCEMGWTLFVDGYGKDGKRIYDPVGGKTCHQCRQKTLGHRTHCSKCNMVQGQFCGDCLFMRYGENVLEATKNPNWICPVCRGICNCSLCRIKKGWAPTGSLYRKVVSMGYKSVAHYLIQTRRQQKSSGEQNSSESASAEDSSHVENHVELEDDIKADFDGKDSKMTRTMKVRSETMMEKKSPEGVNPMPDTGMLCTDGDSAENIAEKIEENECPDDVKPVTDSIASRLRKRHKP